MSRRIPALYKFLNLVHERLFTWSRGWIGGSLLGMTVVKLTTTGRRSGLQRETMITSPLVVGDEIVLVASFRGGPKHPAWYLNLRDNPHVHVERHGWRGPMIAETVTGAQRDRLWRRLTAAHRRYEKYQSRTTRVLPVVVLRPADRERSLLLES